MNFSGKSVIITGSGAGIGEAAAVMFAEAGANVVVNARSKESCDVALARVLKTRGKAIAITADVSTAAGADMLLEKAIQAFGKVDILVNSAGIVITGRVETCSEQDWDKTMDVNVKSVYLMCRRAIPLMLAQKGGVIVNVASVIAHKGTRERAIYAASKGAVAALSKSMAADYLKDNIRINCVSPGTTDSPSLRVRAAAVGDCENVLENIKNTAPMGRIGTPEEIAHAILFAACDEASYLNGADIWIDGGVSI